VIIRTKSRIAIAALIDVAAHETKRPVSLAGVAERRGISLSYLEQLFKRLRLQGIVGSYRGPGGGYRLNRHLATITVADIIAAVDEEDFDNCDCPEIGAGQEGKTHSLWCQVNHHMHHYLKTVTLASIIEQCYAVPTFRTGMLMSPARTT
jgi:Rrf2 family transcriptional regulator, iron-sulfur cluster assembly transcription factor